MKKLLVIILLNVSLVGHSQNIDYLLLEEIKRKSEESHSDAIIIMQNGKVVYEEYTSSNEPVYLASAGKSLASLACRGLSARIALLSLKRVLSACSAAKPVSFTRLSSSVLYCLSSG